MRLLDRHLSQPADQPGRGRTATYAHRVGAVVLLAITTMVFAPPAFADKIRDDQWHLSFLDIARAHTMSQGEGITVAVIDGGIDHDHPDLVGNVLGGLDVVAGGNGDGWGDADGHGTGMAGLIAAHGHGADNSSGALGIAPKAKILPIRIDTGAGLGDGIALAHAVEEAVNRGANIISISLDSDANSYDPIQNAIKAGVLVVASSGNQPDSFFVGDPAAHPDVLTVGAVGRDGNIADVSVRGPQIELAAPGVDIISSSRDGKYRIGTGTSPSTAIVAGAAALVWSKYPQLTNLQLIDHLTSSATDNGTPGRDDEYGFGVLNVIKALETAPVPATPGQSATPAPVVPSGPDTATESAPAAAPATEVRDEDGQEAGIATWIGIAAAGVLLVAVAVFVARRRTTS